MRLTVNRIFLVVAALLLLGSVGWSTLHSDAAPSGVAPQYRVAAVDSQGIVYHADLIAQDTYTMPGTTPVTGSTVCIPGDFDIVRVQFTLGAAPTFAAGAQVTNTLQVSYDKGATWSNVGSSFAAVNATLTPAGGQEAVTLSDVLATTAVAAGDCYRVTTTWAGSAATTTANYGVSLMAK